MYLKMMSGENAPDHDPGKRFKLLSDVFAVDFERVADADPEQWSWPQARVTFKDGRLEYYRLEGNAYVLSENGKTISSFSHSPIPGTPCAPPTGHDRAPTP